MLGAIIGDIVGSVYEFDNTKNYNFRLLSSESSYTDDSIMTVAVADWLIKDPKHGLDTLEESLVNFGKLFPCPKGSYGNMFHRWLFASGNPTGERHPYGSWGNGSAMRASACGWFFDTVEETESVAKTSAEITHNHPEGIKGAQATSAAIWMARKGHTKKEIRDYIESHFGYDLSTTWEEYNRTYSWEDSCQGTVPPAIVCFLESVDFEDAIRKAVSVGGDSDTLASITGGIAEAFYGTIPDEMLEFASKNLPQIIKSVLKNMADISDYGKLFHRYSKY